MGHMGIGVQRHIGNRVLLTHQIRCAIELLLHHVQRLVPAFLQLAVLLKTLLGQPQVELDKARHRNVRLMAVLLEKLPLQHLGAQARFGR